MPVVGNHIACDQVDISVTIHIHRGDGQRLFGNVNGLRPIETACSVIQMNRNGGVPRVGDRDIVPINPVKIACRQVIGSGPRAELVGICMIELAGVIGIVHE